MSTQLRKKWHRWLRIIQTDLANLLTDNDIFKELRGIVAANEKIQSPATIHGWMTRNYAEHVAVGIRRLTDTNTNKRTISLHGLIEDIKRHPQGMTRSCYVSTYPKWMLDMGAADHDFDQFANKGDNVVSEYKLSQDMRRLKKATNAVRRFVNKWVAHCDLKRQKYKVPTFKDVDKSLEEVDKVFCKYYMLLTRVGRLTCKPVLQFDWREPLRHAWLSDDGSEEEPQQEGKHSQ
jgi:hypothetical protein